MRQGRRRFLKKFAFGSGVVALAAGGTSFYLFRSKKECDHVCSGLKSAIRGQVVTGERDLAFYSTDYSQAIAREPRIVVFPADIEDIRTTFRFASEKRIPVSIRGNAHSGYGQSLCESGIVIHAPAGRWATPKGAIPTGLTWSESLRELGDSGSSHPVLPLCLNITVGGSLSVSGIGPGSIRHGLIVDQLESFELITPTGDRLSCSRESEPEVFRYAPASLGQLGYISSVRLKLAKGRKRIFSRFSFTARDPRAYGRAMDWLQSPPGARITHAYGDATSQGFHLTFGAFTDNPGEAALGETAKFIRSEFNDVSHSAAPDFFQAYSDQVNMAIANLGAAYRMLMAYTHASFEEHVAFATEAVRRLSQAKSSTHRVDLLWGRTSPVPLSIGYFPGREFFYGVGLNLFVRERGDFAVRESRDLFRSLGSQALSRGGRPYLFGHHALTARERQSVYGDHYEALRRLKLRHDPGWILSAATLVEQDPA